MVWLVTHMTQFSKVDWQVTKTCQNRSQCKQL